MGTGTQPYQEFLIGELRRDRKFAIYHLKRGVEELNIPEDRDSSLDAINNIILAYGGLDEIGREAGISQEALAEALAALHESGHAVMLAEAA